MSQTAQKATDGPRLVGAVAALWLDYVHDLIVFVREIRQEWSVDQWAAVCDRIEDNLKHLEQTAMPIPNLTMEELIEMGKQMLQAELVAKEQGDQMEESYREALADTQHYLEIGDDGRKLDRCVMCGDAFDSELHREACLCSECGYPLKSAEHAMRCNEEKPSDDRAAGEGDEEPAKLPHGYCKKCRNHGASRAHKSACMPKVPAAPKETEEPAEVEGPTNQQGGAVRCERCGGHTFLEGDDIVCLQCGARVVGQKVFGASPTEKAMAV